MQREDWVKVARWMGYVYFPIVLLIIFIFILIQWNSYKVDSYKKELGQVVASSSTWTLP